MTNALLRTARPKQWLKNLLVFAAPGAAGVLDQPRELVLTLITFVAFCAAASGIYFWNDIFDVESDRRHPTKRTRPIAAGELSIGAARAAGVVLPVVALGLHPGGQLLLQFLFRRRMPRIVGEVVPFERIAGYFV